MWNILRDELREVAWLVSVVAGLSVLGVAVALGLVALMPAA